MEARSAAEWAFRLGCERVLVEGLGAGATPVAVFPADMKVESLEFALAAPVRKKGVVEALCVEGLVDYVTRHKTPGSMGYLDVEGGMLTVFLDGHVPGADAAGWGQHLVKMAMPLSPEIAPWVALRGKELGQQEFAEFIEDQAPVVQRPVAAAVMEMALSLQAKKGVAFKNGLRLENGDVQLVYEETTTATAGRKGEMEVPSVLELYVPVVRGEVPGLVVVKLRYRVREGKLSFEVRLPGLDAIVRGARRLVGEAVRKEAGVPVMEGRVVG